MKVTAKSEISARIKLFKQVLAEAADFYSKPAYAVTYSEFMFLSQGRLGRQKIDQLGGFATLREYSAPAPKSLKTTEARQTIQRILKGIEKCS